MQRKQIQILLQPVVNRRIPVRAQRALEQRDGLRSLTARRQRLGLHLKRRPQRQWQVRIGIERALLQLLLHQCFRLLRIGCGLVVLALIERSPP